MNFIKFYISAAIVFFLERIAPLFFDFIIILFPVLIVFYLIQYSAKLNVLWILAPVVLIFDVFSGMKFGVLILSFLLFTAILVLAEKNFDIKGSTLAGRLLRVAIFVFIFLLIQTGVNSILSYPDFLTAWINFYEVYFNNSMYLILLEIFIAFLVLYRIIIPKRSYG